jgi:hypothetical protein
VPLVLRPSTSLEPHHLASDRGGAACLSGGPNFVWVIEAEDVGAWPSIKMHAPPSPRLFRSTAASSPERLRISKLSTSPECSSVIRPSTMTVRPLPKAAMAASRVG